MEIDIKSAHGLIPAIVQDSETKNVLMLGYMNEEAYQKTIENRKHFILLITNVLPFLHRPTKV